MLDKSAARQVVIVHRRLTHYRVPLFERLRGELEASGVRLRLVHGQPAPKELGKRDSGQIDWAEHVENRYWRIGATDLCWQQLPESITAANLVIVTQENSLLSNYPLLFRRRRNGLKVAFWGHGANFQSKHPNGMKESFKRWTARQADWWFAYTQLSADLVRASGFPAERITVLNNAVDTSELQRQVQSITEEEKQALRMSLGFGPGPVGIYVGSLYADKRLGFLLAAAEAIRREIPDFQLLILGDGPERDYLRTWCADQHWANWAGALFSREKAAHLSMAHVMLNPGSVGLGILDSFSSGVPLLTTDCGTHGPEIAYLKDGVNGVMTADSLDAFVDACVSILRNAGAHEALHAGCKASAERYTLESLAARFADGIAKALAV